jgi:predicted enzyme related to lactoylglutathione lyase
MQETINDKMLTKNKYEIIIFVNGEEKMVKKDKISYEEVIELAFGHYEDNETINYSVIYFKGNNDKPNGFLLKGQVVMVKKGMRINVTRTNKS